MRTFACDNCNRLVFFHNTSCLNCGHELAFDWEERELVTFPAGAVEHRCANADIAACNGLVPAPDELCFACGLTRTRPADADTEWLDELQEAEAAKRHVLFELGELGLPVESFREREGGLAFDLLASDKGPVTTGHANGVITLDLAESDDVHRVTMRKQLQEPYRTLLGHFRHEIGHYYFPILTAGDAELARAREAFGDETADYQAALDRHYEQGPPANWRERYVSAYATMHPAEDFAETFAHFLHIHDTLQTAAEHQLRVEGPANAEIPRGPEPEGPDDFGGVVSEWLPLTYALNAINRSMGRPDLYPFVLSPDTIAKLDCVADLIRIVRRPPS